MKPVNCLALEICIIRKILVENVSAYLTDGPQLP